MATTPEAAPATLRSLSKDFQRRSLATLVDNFEAHGNDLAIVSTRGVRENRTTYCTLAELSRRFAAHLEDAGIRKGDRVIIWGENCTEWTAAFFGCVLRGVLPVPLDVTGSYDFALQIATDVRPSLVVGDAEKIGNFQLSSLPFPSFQSGLPSRLAGPLDELSSSDALQIVFTSGTTGQPKGIVHTHANVLSSLEPIEREVGHYLKYERPFHPIRIMHTLPLSHVFGQFMGLWTPALLGAELHYETRLVARDLVHKIKQDRISVLAAVPRVLDLLREYVLEQFPAIEARLAKASSMKAWQRWWYFRDVHRTFGLKFWAFVCGGAALPSSAEKFWGTLGFVVVQGYGMTETTALVSLNHPFRAARGTIGQVLPGREVKLSDEGEVLVRGETISNTTWQQGGFHNTESDWLHTGDLADFDPQGNLRFRGRKKDVIVTSAGLNIYPEDLEAALNNQAGVKASAVIEIAGAQGPEPAAVLVLTPGTSLESVVEAANSQLAPYQRIQRYQLWPKPDLPRTSTGKILKREITLDPFTEATGELNLDSLGRVELQAKIEQQFGVSLNDADLEQVRTQGDVDLLLSNAIAGQASVISAHRYWKWPWNPIAETFRTVFLEAIALPLLRLLANPTVHSGNLEMPPGPALIVCNHVTAYDAPFVLLALPSRMRHRVAIAMSGEMLLDYRQAKTNLFSPLAYWLVTALFNVFPMPRSAGFRDSFRHAGQAVDRGYSILVFPEGRRSPDGEIQAFRGGAGLLWKQLSIPLIPVHISGMGELKKSSHRRWFRSGRLSVQVGGAVLPDLAALPEELTERMRQAVLTASQCLSAKGMSDHMGA